MGVYFLRHLKTTNNDNNIISGSKDTDVLPNQIIKLDSHTPYFDYVFCSPLLRCRRTIELLPKDIIGEIYYLDSLVERNVGVLEGVDRKIAILRYPELFVNNKINVNKVIPLGENIKDIQKRLESEALLYISKYKSKNILVCSHNQTLKILYSMIFHINIDNTFWRITNFENGVVININEYTINFQ